MSGLQPQTSANISMCYNISVSSSGKSCDSESPGTKQTRALPGIVDQYLRFYYRYIAPARSNLERGLVQQAWQNIQKHLPEFVGTFVFEELCREWVLQQGDAGHLPFVHVA